MSRTFIHRASAGTVTAVLLSLPGAAQACTVCMGDVNSKTAGAMNAAIFLMLGAIGFMLASFGGFAFYLYRRACAPTPAYADLDPSRNDSDDLS